MKTIPNRTKDVKKELQNIYPPVREHELSAGSYHFNRMFWLLLEQEKKIL